MKDQVFQALQYQSLTAVEISEATGHCEAMVRMQLAELVFADNVITCDRDGTYRLGDPTALLVMA